jgi:predicted transcriptional regulator
MSSLKARSAGNRRKVHVVQRRSRTNLHVRRINVDGKQFDTDNFLDNLQSLLFHQEGTQKKLAEHADLAPSTIANLVYRRTREPRATTLLKILAAKGVVLEARVIE